MQRRIIDRLAADGVLTPATVSAWNALHAAGHSSAAGKLLLSSWLTADKAGLKSTSPLQVLQPKLAGLQPCTFRIDNFDIIMGPEQPKTSDYIKKGFCEGFRIHRSPDWTSVDFKSATPPSAAAAAAMADLMRTERELGYTCPVPDSYSAPLQLNPFFVLEKRISGAGTGKFRGIENLSKGSTSHPSVNSQIDRSMGTISFPTLADFTTLIFDIQRSGATDARMGKIDIRSGYRNIPIHPDDWGSLAFRDFNGVPSFDTRMTMGLLPAARIFSSVSGTISWILIHAFDILNIIYIDDYGFAAVDEEHSQSDIDTALMLFEILGVPVSVHKTEAGKRVMIFLGVEVDLTTHTLRFPAEKIHRVKTLLATWLDRASASVRDVETLAGILCDCTRVIPQGKMFLNRIFATLVWARSRAQTARNPQFLSVAVGAALRADVRWWYYLLDHFNGVRSMTDNHAPLEIPSVINSNDASDSSIAGVFLKEFFKLNLDITGPLAHWHKSRAVIATREMLALCVACGLWGPEWAGRHVRFLCDNKGDVDSVIKQRNRNDESMHLMRVIAYLALIHNFTFEIVWIRSEDNKIADWATRLSLSDFQATCSDMHARVISWLPPLPSDPNWETTMCQRLLDSLISIPRRPCRQ